MFRRSFPSRLSPSGRLHPCTVNIGEVLTDCKPAPAVLRTRAGWRGGAVARLFRVGGRGLGLLILLAAPAACKREDEASLRDRLEPWFAVGETLAFTARRDCAAAAFRLVHAEIGAGVAVASSVPEMLRVRPGQRALAVDAPDLAPDAAMVAIVNADRPTGMAMRRAALEARACMAGPLEGTFRQTLLNPRAVLVWDGAGRTVLLLDRDAGLLVVAMGEG